MKNIFYSFFLIFFLCFSLFANELDEEFIDKKYNEIKTSDFCSTKDDFVQQDFAGHDVFVQQNTNFC